MSIRVAAPPPENSFFSGTCFGGPLDGQFLGQRGSTMRLPLGEYRFVDTGGGTSGRWSWHANV